MLFPYALGIRISGMLRHRIKQHKKKKKKKKKKSFQILADQKTFTLIIYIISTVCKIKGTPVI
jgi:hypothetical protein